MSLLSARNLVKAYGPQTLFNDLALTVEEGDRIGLLGVNGTGKSTLLRVLAGFEPSDGGVIDRQRGASIRYLAQEPNLDPKATPRLLVGEGLTAWHDAVKRHGEATLAIGSGSDVAAMALQAELAESVEHLGGWDREHLVEEMLHKVGIVDLDRAVGTMSGGERRRVALAQLLVAEPQLAILDEPTNHLDVDTIEWLEELLAEKFQGAVLIVTHDRYVLDAIATRIVELEHGKLETYEGNYGDYLEQKAERLAQAGRAESNRMNFLRRERAWLARGPKARSTKQKARIQRAEAAIAVKGPREIERVTLEAHASRIGKTILEFKDASLDIAGRRLIDNLTFHMVSGDRVGIIGPNGVGKTSLLKLVSGELAPTSGQVVRGERTTLAYFDQSRSELVDGWSIYDNVAEREGAETTGGGMVELGARKIDLRTYLEQFLFEPSKQRQKVGSLSGGERARVALAKTLRRGANLLLLDEPTNDLDVMTLGALEEMLENWPGCALVVSHDRYFLNRVVTSILAFEEGKVVHHQGDYDTYRRRRAEALAAEKVATQAKARATKASQPPPKKALSYSERIELDGILAMISAAEEKVIVHERKLTEAFMPDARSSADAAKRVQTDLDRARSEVITLTTRWEELESKR